MYASRNGKVPQRERPAAGYRCNVRHICCECWPQVEARGLKPNTKYFYQFRYRQNDKAAPVRAAAACAATADT